MSKKLVCQMVINAMENNTVKETRLLLGAEEGLLPFLCRIVGKLFI